jgi:hypothetical protein
LGKNDCQDAEHEEQAKESENPITNSLRLGVEFAVSASEIVLMWSTTITWQIMNVYPESMEFRPDLVRSPLRHLADGSFADTISPRNICK